MEPQLTIPVAGTVTNLKWDPKGEYLAATAQSGEVPFLYDLNTATRLRSANNTLLWQDTTSRAEYRNLSWKVSGKVLASASDGVRFWSVDGKELRHGLRDRYVWGIAWSPGAANS
ncbi:MAG: hypothetical protein WA952_03155 [Lewinella sp.]